jgi:hypothetical protein
MQLKKFTKRVRFDELLRKKKKKKKSCFPNHRNATVCDWVCWCAAGVADEIQIS